MILGVLAAGCLMDEDDRCGPNQQLVNDTCICAEGTAYSPTGCVACGENEMATAAGCVCVTGFVRPAPTDVCMPIPEGQSAPEGAGKACTSDADCAGTDAVFCDLAVSHSCLVQGCTVSPNDCFTGTECCDFTAFGWGTLCIPAGACMQ